MSERNKYAEAMLDIKAAIEMLKDADGADSIISQLKTAYAAAQMNAHHVWSERPTWIAYPNGFLATIAQTEVEGTLKFRWYVRPTGLTCEQYGVAPTSCCDANSLDFLMSGFAKDLAQAKTKVMEAAEELLKKRRRPGNE